MAYTEGSKMVKANADFVQFTYKKGWMAAGATEEHAEMVARAVSLNDRLGKHYQGMGVIEVLFHNKNVGVLDVKAEPEIVNEGPTWTVFEGNKTSGYYVLTEMMKKSIEKAKEYGVAVAFGGNHNDAGGFFAYTSMATENDMFAIATNNTIPLVAPYGGMENLLGCPPFDAACPAGDELPLVTSVKFGEVYDADIADCGTQKKKLKGKWLVDPNTGELTDEVEPYWQPIEGLGRISDCSAASVFEHPRTYALNIFSEVINSIINPIGKLGTELPHLKEWRTKEAKLPNVGGSFVLVIDPSKFGDIKNVKEKADRLTQQIKANKKRPMVNEVRMPSEPGLKKIYGKNSENSASIDVEILEEHWNAYYTMLERDYNLSLEELKKEWENRE